MSNKSACHLTPVLLLQATVCFGPIKDFQDHGAGGDGGAIKCAARLGCPIYLYIYMCVYAYYFIELIQH